MDTKRQDSEGALQALSQLCNLANGKVSVMLNFKLPESDLKRDQLIDIVKEMNQTLKGIIHDFKLPITNQQDMFTGTPGEVRDAMLIRRLEELRIDVARLTGS